MTLATCDLKIMAVSAIESFVILKCNLIPKNRTDPRPVAMGSIPHRGFVPSNFLWVMEQLTILFFKNAAFALTAQDSDPDCTALINNLICVYKMWASLS